MPGIAAVGTALPSHCVTQDQAVAACERAYADHPSLRRLLRVFKSSGVERRWFSFPPDYYLEGRSFEDRNADFIEQATGLAERAARNCLSNADVRGEEIDHLLVV